MPLGPRTSGIAYAFDVGIQADGKLVRASQLQEACHAAVVADPKVMDQFTSSIPEKPYGANHQRVKDSISSATFAPLLTYTKPTANPDLRALEIALSNFVSLSQPTSPLPSPSPTSSPLSRPKERWKVVREQHSPHHHQLCQQPHHQPHGSGCRLNAPPSLTPPWFSCWMTSRRRQPRNPSSSSPLPSLTQVLLRVHPQVSLTFSMDAIPAKFFSAFPKSAPPPAPRPPHQPGGSAASKGHFKTQEHRLHVA